MLPRRSRAGWSGRYIEIVASYAADLPSDPAVVVINPDEEVTAESFQAWLDEVQVGEPFDPGVTAAEILAEIRANADW